MTDQPSTSWANWAWQAYRDGRLIEAPTLPAVTVGVKPLRDAFEAGLDLGWDQGKQDECGGPEPTPPDEVFAAFLAALELTPASDPQAVKRVVDLLDDLTERQWVIDGLTLSELKEITDAICAVREVQSHKSE